MWNRKRGQLLYALIYRRLFIRRCTGELGLPSPATRAAHSCASLRPQEPMEPRRSPRTYQLTWWLSSKSRNERSPGGRPAMPLSVRFQVGLGSPYRRRIPGWLMTSCLYRDTRTCCVRGGGASSAAPSDGTGPHWYPFSHFWQARGKTRTRSGANPGGRLASSDGGRRASGG